MAAEDPVLLELLADLAEVAQVLHPDQDMQEEQEILPQYHLHKEMVEAAEVLTVHPTVVAVVAEELVAAEQLAVINPELLVEAEQLIQ